MELKPLNDKTIIMDRTNLRLKSIKKNKKNSLIQNGMQKIIKNEKTKQNIIFCITFFISFLIIAYIIVLATIYKSSWSTYIVPIVSISLFLYKLIKTLYERKNLNYRLREYEDSLKLDSKYMPPFITEIYKKTLQNQVYHNWITFTILFYGIITTFLIWLLKDVSWWIFDFKYFIRQIVADPDMWIKIFSSLLVVIFIMHLIFTVQRNIKKENIKSFFGQEIISLTDEQNIKKIKNKFSRRLFIFSLMLLTIIPIFVTLILRRRKK